MLTPRAPKPPEIPQTPEPETLKSLCEQLGRNPHAQSLRSYILNLNPKTSLGLGFRLLHGDGCAGREKPASKGL